MRRTPLPPDALDETDRFVMNRLQDALPIVARPYAALGQEMGLDETELLVRIERLLSIGALTRFGPFIDAAALGGAFCLCAMAAPEDDFDRIAGLVNAHPAVAHNYQRAHRPNMWFVLACENEADITTIADRIEQQTALPVLRFPKLKEFFIRFRVAA